MKFHPAKSIQDLQYFGEFGGVNPSIEDSSTFTFLKAQKMEEVFEKEVEGCYLYSRHWNPTNRYLSDALAKMENTEAAIVTASGMAAITATLLQLCSAGDQIICSRMVYGGTYAFLKNVAPRHGIVTRFVDITNLEKVEQAVNGKTKVIFCEAMSNPLLEVTDLPAISALCRKYQLQFVVDNTFTPMIITPQLWGADVVIHSLTKFVNGMSDTVGGVICGTHDFVNRLVDVHHGTVMLLGPVMDAQRASSILKNLHTLHVRIKQHSYNALHLAEQLMIQGLDVRYPGLPGHPQHELMKSLMNDEYGFGGMLILNMHTKERAYALMEKMQHANVGYLAVSLGYFKTLFSSPGSSTSSEIPDDERLRMGLTDGLIRMSIGLDEVIANTEKKIISCVSALESQKV